MNHRRINSLVNNLRQINSDEANEVATLLSREVGHQTTAALLNLVLAGLVSKKKLRGKITIEDAHEQAVSIKLKLIATGPKKIQVIKALRHGFGHSSCQTNHDGSRKLALGLREAKVVADTAKHEFVWVGTPELGDHLDRWKLIGLYYALVEAEAEVEVWVR